ncbi:MAG: flagellar hook-length control protein FliK [Geothrix sp.]|nr:flagellar hook-length control protein FliK [Geothrix sp.]
MDPAPAAQAVLAANLTHPLGRKAEAGFPAAGNPDPVTTPPDPASSRLTPEMEVLPPDAATHLAPVAKPLDRPSAESIPALQTAVPGAEDTLAPVPAPALMGIEAEPLPLEAQAFKGAGPLPFVQGHPGATAGAALAAAPLPAQPVQVTSPAPAMPAPAPPPPPAVAQVDGGLRWMLRGGAQEARLQLHPESLGQVTIHLKVEGGEVHARLWITEPASVQAVQEGRPHLEQSLKEQGLQLGSFDLQQGQRPFQEAPSAPLFRGQPDLPAQAARQEAPAPPPPSILNTHHVELYA